MNTSDNNRILVVDDEDDVRQLFRKFISKKLLDVSIDVAANGKEAVEMCREVDYSVIIMDMVMPVMNGAQAFKEIEQLCATARKTMPVFIFCTGYDPDTQIETFVKSNRRHCILGKPVASAVLIDAVRSGMSSVSSI